MLVQQQFSELDGRNILLIDHDSHRGCCRDRMMLRSTTSVVVVVAVSSRKDRKPLGLNEAEFPLVIVLAHEAATGLGCKLERQSAKMREHS